jgi:hypothetical protein
MEMPKEDVFEPVDLQILRAHTSGAWMIKCTIKKYDFAGVGKTLMEAIAEFEKDYHQRGHKMPKAPEM